MFYRILMEQGYMYRVRIYNLEMSACFQGEPIESHDEIEEIFEAV